MEIDNKEGPVATPRSGENRTHDPAIPFYQLNREGRGCMRACHEFFPIS